ncbi:MAG: ABC transporter substrate-binding protein [Thermomicrobiales bacterium]
MGTSRYSRRGFVQRAGGLGATLAAGGLLGAGAFRARTAHAQERTVDFFARGDDAIFGVFKKLRDAFQEQEPDIEVVIEEVPGDYYQKFQLKLASGTPPDCLFECDCSITSSIRAGALEPLDDLIAADPRFKKEDYLDIAWYTSQYEGKTYGLPYDGGAVAVYYNLDLFEAAQLEPPNPAQPLTWDQFLEYARLLTLDRDGKHPGEDGFDARRIKQYGFNPGATWLPWLWVWGNGGEVITEDGQVPLDDPTAVEGLQLLVDMNLKQSIAPSPQLLLTETISFLTGHVAMVYAGVWSMVRYRDAPFNWDVMPFPQGKVPVSTGWYSPLSITAGAKDKEAAWKWISFCTSEEGQTIVSQLGQAVPPLKRLSESEHFLDPATKPASKQVFLDQLNPAILRTPGDKMGKYFGGYVREFRDVFNPIWEAALRGDKPVADAMAEARPKLEELLKTGKVS